MLMQSSDERVFQNETRGKTRLVTSILIACPDQSSFAGLSSFMSTLGIVAALHHEIASLLDQMSSDAITRRIGQRDYHIGTLMNRRCVLVLARVGKVAAAATVVTLIREFQVSSVIFTGVAGALAADVKVGDVVIADTLLQHDMDASPLFPQYEVPLLGRSHFDADAGLSAKLRQSADSYVLTHLHRDVDSKALQQFGLGKVVVHRGMIVSGDQFVNCADEVLNLRARLPGALCVEMEGAAVAQVCHEYGTPFAIMRIISDRADGSASVDFSAFLTEVARYYSAGILRQYLGEVS